MPLVNMQYCTIFPRVIMPPPGFCNLSKYIIYSINGAIKYNQSTASLLRGQIPRRSISGTCCIKINRRSEELSPVSRRKRSAVCG